MTTETQRQKTSELLAWMAADLVKCVQDQDWMGAAVNAMFQSERLTSLAELCVAVMQAETSNDTSVGMVLDLLLETDRQMMARMREDFPPEWFEDFV
jgi:hypothetical protein